MRYDMKCVACENVFEVWAVDASVMSRRVAAKTEESGTIYKGPCPYCDRETFQSQTYLPNQQRNHIHSQHSGMYGKFHPGFGEVVEDYAHKQRLLKKYDLREAADPIDGSRTVLGDTDVMGEGYVHDPNVKAEQERVAGKAKADQQKALASIQWA